MTAAPRLGVVRSLTHDEVASTLASAYRYLRERCRVLDAAHAAGDQDKAIPVEMIGDVERSRG